MTTTEQVKALRDKTGISIMQCQKALEEAGGDEARALAILEEKGAAIAAKKSDRTLGAGVVESYIHNTGKIGAMILLQSETDFVAQNPEFKSLAKEIAMHVAAMGTTDREKVIAEPFIKDPSKTVGDLITQATQKFGERILLAEISRLSQ
jgi:elongation factor Ts